MTVDYKLIKLKQKHIESWGEATLDIPQHTRSQEDGAALRAAIVAGWFKTPTTEYVEGDGNGTPPQYLFDGVDVGDMEPWQVTVLAEAIQGAYREAKTVPKN